MKINRNNYETYFIDYFDGELDEKLVNDFIEFLQQNPDLKSELSLFETVKIEPEEIIFSHKELLMKEKYDVEQAFNEAAIARLEGEISPSENTEFEKYLSTHPEKQKEADLFKLTKLVPDESVNFSKKNTIYRRTAGRTAMMWPLRVAAIFVVALSVYTFIEKSSFTVNPETQIAAIEKKSEKKPIPEEIKETPIDTEKKEAQPTINVKSEKASIKKEKPKPGAEPSKSLRENAKGRLGPEDVAANDIDYEVPLKLQGLSPTIYAGIPKTELASVAIKYPETIETFKDEKLLVDIVKEKAGIEKINFNIITKAGLSLVSNISNEKFNYETNSEGKITEVKYDSRILAFSIPTKNESVRK
jgi:hypothetical protein